MFYIIRTIINVFYDKCSNTFASHRISLTAFVLFVSHRLVSPYSFDRLYDTKISGRYVNRESYVFAQSATVRRRASNQSDWADSASNLNQRMDGGRSSRQRGGTSLPRCRRPVSTAVIQFTTYNSRISIHKGDDRAARTITGNSWGGKCVRSYG